MRKNLAFIFEIKTCFAKNVHWLFLTLSTAYGVCAHKHVQWQTLCKIFFFFGGGRQCFNMHAFGIRLRYANLLNIMLGISNSLFNYCNVTITLYA